METAQITQLDMFIKDLRELEKHQAEEKVRKDNKRVRAMFHMLGDLAKEIKEKTP